MAVVPALRPPPKTEKALSGSFKGLEGKFQPDPSLAIRWARLDYPGLNVIAKIPGQERQKVGCDPNDGLVIMEIAFAFGTPPLPKCYQVKFFRTFEELV